MKNYLSCLALALTTAVPSSASPAPAGAPSDAFAALDAQDMVPIAGGTAVPSLVPVKATNYPVPPGAIFVAPDGKANAPGTSLQAPMTVAQALKNAPAGAVIVFRGGTYRGLNRIKPARRVTLQAAPGEKPVLKGSIVVTGWLPDNPAPEPEALATVPAWRVDNWAFKFAPPPRLSSDYLDPKYPLASERDMVYLNDKALTQVASRGEVGPGKFFVDGTAQKLYIGDDPAGATVEATTGLLAFDWNKQGDADPTGSIVRGLSFYHYADYGMNVRAPDMTIEDCTFAWNGQAGFNTYDASNGNLRGNMFACNARVGMRASRVRRLVVEKNVFAFNNVEHFRTAWDAAGTKITNMAYGPEDGLVFRDNIVERNLCTGLWLDIDANHPIVVRNLVRFNQGIGLFFEISDTGLFAFNAAHGNGTGIMISNSRNLRVYNNTLVANGNNVIIKETNRKNAGNGLTGLAGKSVAGTLPGETFATTGNILRNNILFDAREGSDNPLLNAGSTRVSSSSMIASSDYNLFGRRDAAKPPLAVRWSLDGKTNQEFASLDAFRRAVTGYEEHSIGADGAVLFVDAAKGDFRLRAGSLAVGKADAVPADIAAAVGVPENDGYLGALPAAP